MYTTTTNGPGDKRAEARHAREVHRMMTAAARAACPKGHSVAACDCLY